MSYVAYMRAQWKMLLAIGPKPPFWRPNARRLWKQKHAAILEISYEQYENAFQKFALHVIRGGKA